MRITILDLGLFIHRHIELPEVSIPEHTCINDALRTYKKLYVNDVADIDNVAVVVSRNGVLYKQQFMLLWKALLFYKLNFQPGEYKYGNNECVVDNIIYKLKGVMDRYGLDRDEGGKREAE